MASNKQACLRMTFHVSVASLGRLRNVLRDYAEGAGYAVQDVGSVMPHQYIDPPFFVNLTRNEAQIVMTNIGHAADMLLLIHCSRKADGRDEFAPLLASIKSGWPDMRVYAGP